MPSVLSKPYFAKSYEDSPSSRYNTQTTYYKNLSKYLTSIETLNKDSQPPHIKYNDWRRSNGTVLHSIKLCELKQTARVNKLPVSGNKAVLIERIDSHFKKHQSAICIQRVFRGFLVREMEQMHGHPLVECVNDTDFHMMCPLTDIPHAAFFSYCSADGFVYGFNALSLIILFKCTTRFENPYTREVISGLQIYNLMNLYRKLRLVCPHLCNLDDATHQFAMNMCEMTLSSRSSRSYPYESSNIREDYEFVHFQDVSENHPSAEEIRNEEAESVVRDITFYLSLDERIELVFKKMSELIGSHIKSEWFCNFGRNEYERFYNFYYVWWTRLNGLCTDERQKVCGITDPFELFHTICNSNISDEYYKLICVGLMENMVYTGIDEEYQKKGAMQTLTVLTIVSREARTEWPDLFV